MTWVGDVEPDERAETNASVAPREALPNSPQTTPPKRLALGQGREC